MTKLLLVLLLSFSVSAQTDLRHKISQMIMVGFPGTAVSDTILINDLQVRGVGGVILFAGNIESPAQLQQLTAQLQSLSQVPLYISIDQEGGRIARLGESNGYSSTYTAYEIGTIFNEETITREWAGLMSGWLKDGGINVNLAPVADVNVNPASPAIGNRERSFSKIPDSVFQHCYWFIDESHQKNIINTLKHFPGHGSADTDSHLGFTDITVTWADSELVPFQKLIQSGYRDFIMMGHLYNANLDSVYPSSLSYNVTTALLRNQLGFDGIIITDGMFMGAITNNYSFSESVTLAINAGNDILLYTSNKLNGKSLVDSVVNIVLNKISLGVISEARIEDSYSRIIQMKGLTGLNENAGNVLPDDYQVINYPNPFNSSTIINIRIPEAGLVSVKVYNIIGEEIAEIANDYLPAGTHKFLFDAGVLSSGVYLLRMNSGENFLSHKIILLR
jgi:beta-N-acetylhexosaminidase